MADTNFINNILFWVVQSLGIFALVFYGLSFQAKTKENLLIMQVISNIFSTVQFILTAAVTGAVQTMLGVLRGIVFYFYKKRGLNPDKIVLAVFEIAIILGAVLTWGGILSVFPLVGMTANLYGQWQNDMKLIKIFAIISAVLWSVYALYTGVYTAMLTELLKIVSSVVGLVRFKKIEKGGENQNG